MVDSQVRPSDITDRRIIRAMLDVPREAFVPPDQKALAYADRDLVVSGAAGLGLRAILAPRTLAKLVQALDIDGGDTVLDVAAATGYSSAVLAKLAAKVVALESDITLAGAARGTLKDLGIVNVTVVEGDPKAGHPPLGPYDAILINGAVEEVPPALIGQIKDGGRLVAIVSSGGRAGRAVILQRTGSAMAETQDFDASAPLLPGFAKAKGFVF